MILLQIFCLFYNEYLCANPNSLIYFSLRLSNSPWLLECFSFRINSEVSLMEYHLYSCVYRISVMSNFSRLLYLEWSYGDWYLLLDDSIRYMTIIHFSKKFDSYSNIVFSGSLHIWASYIYQQAFFLSMRFRGWLYFMYIYFQLYFPL